MLRADDEPVRVLRVIARLNVGGPALHVSYLTRGLAERGYETTLVAGTVGPGEGSMEYVAQAEGVEPVFMPSLQREIEPLADAVAVSRLVRLIRELRPHVLHTHTAKAGAVGRIAARLAGGARPPVVVHTFHGHVLRGYFGPAKTAFFRMLEQRLAGVSDALVAVSPEVRDDLVALGVAPPERISVIRLGLDLDGRVRAAPGARAEVRAALGVPEGRFLVGWLGRMTEIKRADLLLEAVARARAAGADLEVALVGDGPLRGQLQERAAELGLGGASHFVGFSEQVGSFYAAFDAVALTSANEGTPVSVIEALAASRAVVSTDVGGVSDVVREGEPGFLVPAGDAGALADRLSRLAAEPELCRRLGEHGRATVLPRYGVPRLLGDVDALYRSLLEDKIPATRRRIAAHPRPLTPALRSHPARIRDRDRLRVLLFSQYFPPEVGATQTRVQSFAEHLAHRGHEVTVVCEFPNHPHGVLPPEYRGRLVEDDRSNEYRVLRTWVRASQTKTQVTRIQFYLSYMAMASLVAPLAGRADVVFATSPPLFTGLAGAIVARAMGAPFVLDVRDLWPAAAISLNQLSNPLVEEASLWVEERLYREAEAVVAVTTPFCRHIDALRGRGPRTVMIPNGTLPLFLDETPLRPELRAQLGCGDGCLLATFAGTHGIAQALPSLLEAAALTRGEVDLALVGDGPVKAGLVEEAQRRGLDNVHFHPQVALEDVPPLLRASDALVIPLSGHPTFADFVPSKLIDFMAAGRPVVLTAQGESARILERAGAGLAVPPESPQAVADALRWLRDHPDEAQAMGRRGRAFAARRLREEQAERLEAVLLDAVARRRL